MKSEPLAVFFWIGLVSILSGLLLVLNLRGIDGSFSRLARVIVGGWVGI